MEGIGGLMAFIDRTPTAFHAVENIGGMLAQAGFERLEEGCQWRLSPGGSYFLTRNRSSLVAFRLPKGPLSRFQIVASHGDSPAFKLKPVASRACQGYAMLNVERYGGSLMSTWLDRPLSVAGRLIVREGDALKTRLVNVEKDLAIIPNLPIHFNRGANDGVALNAQSDMQPIYGLEGEDYLAPVAASAGVDREDIVAGDLFLYNRDRAILAGQDDAFILAPRLDDLECAYTSTLAFLEARGGDHADVLCVFDNEEVGSGTRQGADSTLLIETLRRILAALEGAPARLEAVLAGSFMVSADNAHGVHPNHPEKYDGENRVYLNRGVVIKSNAAQKYTSDALSSAVFEQVCARADVPVQRFANRSDVAGGSTLGNIANTHASMPTVDIGLAQLAMHSARETAGAKDVDHMRRALTAFYEAEIVRTGDGDIAVR